MKHCAHVDSLPRPEPAPRSDTCEGCVAAGTHPVQLRLCLECGNVACCDSSPLKHASAHFEETGHPVMRTFEPGESWRWCFLDHVLA
ncbi:UBP-type zinc finger domain-containing protein [Streptomyces sp. NPDC002734]|uniref:UBP-type zinc finger domain-containing protein n=1 Tax=Streptomyces sp. NPDC002734 TaxID=3154426 RepID=UPI0033283D8F